MDPFGNLLATSSDILEQKYYSELKETAQEAIVLLSKEPVV